MKRLVEKTKRIFLFSKKLGFLLGGILFCFNLSAQYFYIPDNDINVMRFEKKGDLKVSLSIATKHRIKTHLAYSPFNHVVFSVGHLRQLKTNTSVFALPGLIKGRNYTASIGLYKSINLKSNPTSFLDRKLKGILIQAHFGGSKNSIKSFDQKNGFNINTYGQNLYFRWSLFLRYEKICVSLSSKRIYQQYTRGVFNGPHSTTNYLFLNFTEIVLENPNQIFAERSIRVQLKTKSVDYYLDHTFTTSNTLRGHNYYTPNTLSFGLVFNINLFNEK